MKRVICYIYSRGISFGCNPTVFTQSGYNYHYFAPGRSEMISIACKAILFDLDGTLVDSATRISHLWQVWSERHNISTDTLLSVMHGRRAIEIVRLVAPHLRADSEVMALENEEIADLLNVKAYPDVIELLSGLPPKQWAIVTSGSRRVAEARIKHVKLPMPGSLVTGDDVSTGKPAPEGYLLAARSLQVQPKDCVVIEDSPAGVQAGNKAKMNVIGVTTTHTARELHGADVIIGGLAELSLNVESNGMLLQCGL
jgi:mannitol-1-/sugar-/sorbitol-6-phosphatase